MEIWNVYLNKTHKSLSKLFFFLRGMSWFQSYYLYNMDLCLINFQIKTLILQYHILSSELHSLIWHLPVMIWMKYDIISFKSS